MLTRKYLLTLLAALHCLMAVSQNEFDIKCHIKESLEGFFEYLGLVNDDEDPVSPYYLASEYKGSHYFLLNGKEMEFEAFLRSYSKKDLGKKLVNHTLIISRDRITKVQSNQSDRRYSVKGRLERKCATGEDYLVKDEALTAIVKFNGLEKDVSILELSFSTPMTVVRPVTNTEYRFEIDKSQSVLSVPYTGGRWKISLRSSSRSVKRYPGIDDMTSYGSWKPVPYKYFANVTCSNDTLSQKMSGRLNANRSKRAKCHTVKLTQEQTGLVINQQIGQSGRPTRIFDYEDEGYDEIDIFFSTKYHFGLSYDYSFEDCRWSLGFLIALNFDFFRGWNTAANSEKDYRGPAMEGKTIHGYTMTVSSLYPQTDNYSEIMDPLNEARHFTSRTMMMALGGFNIASWLRFDLGLGAATAREEHLMKKAYAVDVYHYERRYKNLPVIDDQQVYRVVDEDYYYLDKVRWGFAVRPALVFHIPLESDFEKSLSIGVGYTLVSGLRGASSPDFTLGLRLGY